MALRTPDGIDDIHLLPRNRERALYWLRALGRGTLPECLELDERRYFLTHTAKHDFYAATGIYSTEQQHRIVLKVNRTVPCAGIPLKWLGTRLRDREVRFYRRLADVPNVPRLLGLVGDTGFIHEFVPGQPLSACKHVPDGFFDRVLALFGEVHRRDIAYVDSHKRQNILVGDDGRPYLIDFQISVDLHLGDAPISRWLLKHLQWVDVYHVLKHKSRIRPDELRREEESIVHQKRWFIKIHRLYTTPYQKLLEYVFRRLEKAGRVAPGGSE